MALMSEDTAVKEIEEKLSAQMQEDGMKVTPKKLDAFFQNILHGKIIHYAGGQGEAPVWVLYYIYYSYRNSVTVPKDYSCFKTQTNDCVFCPAADEAAGMLDPGEFEAWIEELPLCMDSPKELLSIVPYCRYSKNEEKIKEIIDKMKKWTDWYIYRQPGRKSFIIARGALMLSDTKAAYDMMEKDKMMSEYARIRGMDADSLRDIRLESYGLDADGKKCYDLGGYTIIVSMQNDLTFSLYHEGIGKFVKSIPKKDADPEKYAACTEDFKALKKGVKSLYKQRINALKEKFLNGIGRKAKMWMDGYLHHVLLQKLGALVVWEYRYQKTVQFFTLSDGKPVQADGTELNLHPDGRISVAHPAEMPEKEIQDWQNYFLTHGIAQAFEHIWEPVIDLQDVKKRYVGIQIPFYLVKSLIGDDFSVAGFCDGMCYGWISSIYASLEVEIVKSRIIHYVQQVDPNELVTIRDVTLKGSVRQNNHFVYMLDKRTVYGHILNNDEQLEKSVCNASLKQLCSYLDFSIEHECTEVTAMLLHIKHEKYPEYEDVDVRFSLD